MINTTRFKIFLDKLTCNLRNVFNCLHCPVFYCTELLENIRKGSAAKPGGSPESISRERSGASEINSLKEKLVERDEKVKNLTEKNARYKASNDRLREEVIELTKNLSLAEVRKSKKCVLGSKMMGSLTA